MKFLYALTAALSAAPFLVTGLAKPELNNDAVTAVARAEPMTKSFDLWATPEKRAKDDDEWTLVIYNGHAKGGQCGGVSNNTVSQEGNVCESLGNVKGDVCADLKVGANIGFAKCDFSFKASGNSCGGKTVKEVSVKEGKDSNGVNLKDDVRFVKVTCHKK